MLVDNCSVGLSSFLQMNVSGGEPCEVQFSVRGEPTERVMVDDDGLVMVGAAVHIIIY